MAADSLALPVRAERTLPRSARQAPSKPREAHIPALDGLRAVAFLLVFTAHAGLDHWVPGGFGVTVFFFLSGYLITTLLRREAEATGGISLRDFYLRRCFRILPPLYVALGLGYLLGALGWLTARGNLFGLLAANAYFYNYAQLLHLHARLPDGLQVLWSLTVEEHFYFVFPLLYLFLLRRGLSAQKQSRLLFGLCGLALLWRVVVVYFIQAGLPADERGWTYSATDCRFDAILFGCILAIRNNPFCNDPSPWLRRRKGLFAVSGLLLLLLTLVVREPHFRLTLRHTLQSLALYPIFYFCITGTHRWQCRWLQARPLRWIGWLSYSLYLSHLMLLKLGDARFPAHHLIAVSASFVLSLLYAWLVRVLVEEPCRRFRSRFHRALPATA